MNLEAVQLLNLSPIPELSELELSTMLEQLSGLSDLNGDLTDRNMEDILKEAENLIDTSMSSKINELPLSDTVLEDVKQTQCPSLNSQEINETQESLSDAKNSNNTAENLTPKSSPTKSQKMSKHYNSPVEQSNKIFLPEGSSNPIKSTIDSLKEFSTFVEKQLSNRSTSSTTENQNNDEKEKNFKKSMERTTASKPVLKNIKQKSNVSVIKTSQNIKINKPGRLLNCFERLYQQGSNRLYKKQKVTDKIPKIMTKKKHVNALKTQISQQGKTSWSKNNSENFRNNINESISDSSLPKHYLEVENWLKKNDSKFSTQSNYMFDILPKKVEDEPENELLLHKPKSSINSSEVDDSKKVSSQINEQLILKLLQGMEEIKDHVKKAGVVKNEVPEKIEQESQDVMDSQKPDSEAVREKVAVESMSNGGLKRLEEQFSVLKNKYEQHIKKLEAENVKLKEALCEKLTPKTTCSETASKAEIGLAAEANKFLIPNISSERKIFRSFSLENCLAPRNSPCSSLEDVRLSARKEACSQTEKEFRSMSIQCFEDPKHEFEEFTVEKEMLKKTENKENLTGRKKLSKERLFSEKNTHQLLKQRKGVSDHESQLLATVRGLQAEITTKEKENRKLKSEINLLKSQMKKSGKKVETCKRRHIGTQTIGLGSVVQKPYNPELYEVPGAFEKENEELKSKVKALEDDFEALKEKRVNDLQALHQVHEEEMAKLLSKLETQSALTKHLHSLLVNR